MHFTPLILFTLLTLTLAAPFGPTSLSLAPRAEPGSPLPIPPKNKGPEIGFWTRIKNLNPFEDEYTKLRRTHNAALKKYIKDRDKRLRKSEMRAKKEDERRAKKEAKKHKEAQKHYAKSWEQTVDGVIGKAQSTGLDKRGLVKEKQRKADKEAKKPGKDNTQHLSLAPRAEPDSPLPNPPKYKGPKIGLWTRIKNLNPFEDQYAKFRRTANAGWRNLKKKQLQDRRKAMKAEGKEARKRAKEEAKKRAKEEAKKHSTRSLEQVVSELMAKAESTGLDKRGLGDSIETSASNAMDKIKRSPSDSEDENEKAYEQIAKEKQRKADEESRRSGKDNTQRHKLQKWVWKDKEESKKYWDSVSKHIHSRDKIKRSPSDSEDENEKAYEQIAKEKQREAEEESRRSGKDNAQRHKLQKWVWKDKEESKKYWDSVSKHMHSGKHQRQ